MNKKLWSKLEKNEKNKIEVHYLSIETKKLIEKHKQHSKIHFEFKPWDGHQMVNTKSLILYYGKKYRPKCNKTNTNKVCSFICI